MLKVDPSGRNFRIEDTGLDIEIILTIDVVSGDSPIKDFSQSSPGDDSVPLGSLLEFALLVFELFACRNGEIHDGR